MIPSSVYNNLQEFLSEEEGITKYCPSEKERVYIAGPMRGYDNLNFDAFFKAEKRLKDQGYCVINPARNPLGLTPEEYIEIDLLYVAICDNIYMLKGWEKSEGAIQELKEAVVLDKQILFEDSYDTIDGDIRKGVDQFLKEYNDLLYNYTNSIINLELSEEEEKESFENKSVFFIGDTPITMMSMFVDMGFSYIFLLDFDLKQDYCGLRDSDFVFREQGYEKTPYFRYLSDLAKEMNKVILDE